MNNLILSCVEGLTAQQLAPFVESIIRCECQARKIMIAYDANEERDRYLACAGWEVVKSERNNDLHIFTQRFADWARIIDEIGFPTMVLSTDCRDVVFQEDPFRLGLTSENIYVASEGIRHQDDEWATNTASANYPEEMGWFLGAKSHCAGTILGGGKLMRELFIMIFRVTVTGRQHRAIPCDQPAFNIIVNQHLTNQRFVEVPWFACTCGTWLVPKFKDALFNDPPEVLGHRVTAFSLVHQYERVPALANAIPKHYCRPVISEPDKTGEFAGLFDIPAFEHDELADRVKGKTVAIVGPADSLKGKGEEIEAADVVVRMNRGFRPPKDNFDDEGSRTDILYHCLLETEQCGGKIAWDELKQDGVMICSPYPREVRPFNNDVAKFMLENRTHRLPWHIIDRDLYLNLCMAVGTRPNTGICAIVDLLAHGPSELRVYGFDFFESGWRKSYKVDNRLQHYRDSEFDGNHHQGPQRRLVEDLVEKGLLELMNGKVTHK